MQVEENADYAMNREGDIYEIDDNDNEVECMRGQDYSIY